MAWIRLCSHSNLAGAVGLCGDVIDAEESAAEYLAADGSCCYVPAPDDFKAFVQVPSLSGGKASREPGQPAEESEPPTAEPASTEQPLAEAETIPTENPRRAKR